MAQHLLFEAIDPGALIVHSGRDAPPIGFDHPRLINLPGWRIGQPLQLEVGSATAIKHDAGRPRAPECLKGHGRELLAVDVLAAGEEPEREEEDHYQGSGEAAKRDSTLRGGTDHGQGRWGPGELRVCELSIDLIEHASAKTRGSGCGGCCLDQGVEGLAIVVDELPTAAAARQVLLELDELLGLEDSERVQRSGLLVRWGVWRRHLSHRTLS